MSKIVLATIGSLGDLHPMIALGLELKRRGHRVCIATWNGYKDKITALGLDFHPLAPNDIDPTDAELNRRVMDAKTGPETVIKDLVVGNIRDTYADLMSAIKDADLFITGEIIYPAATAAKISGVKWISTSFAPVSLFSAHDPSVYIQSSLLEALRPLPALFHEGMLGVMRYVTASWLDEYRKFRREHNLSDDHDPMFRGKFSPLLHLNMFSKALATPQPDWPANSIQTGFCFYDESDHSDLPPELEAFLTNGEPPIVFTLGSAAVMDARDFFDESAKAAKMLDRRAVLLYGRDRPLPKGLDEQIAGFEFAPYSLVFSHAACVVHQGGVGTTAQVLRAGVPHLIMPFSHDQPDNAARCRRAGVAESVNRDSYNAELAAKMLSKILADQKYVQNAGRLKKIVDSEHGTMMACDAIEAVI